MKPEVAMVEKKKKKKRKEEKDRNGHGRDDAYVTYSTYYLSPLVVLAQRAADPKQMQTFNASSYATSYDTFQSHLDTA